MLLFYFLILATAWGSSDAAMMTDGETYVTVVKATNLIGLTMVHKSDGITIQREPLIPGMVYDGDLVGRDLTYQSSVDTISANWDGFGGNNIVETVEHTGKFLEYKISTKLYSRH